MLLGNGNGAFHAPVAIGAGSGTLVAADLNEDGHLDLVTSSGSIYLGDGGGHFPTRHTISTNDGRTIIVRDVNGDGHPDIVVQDGEGAFDIFLNNGSGSFPAGKRYVNDGGFVPGLVAADLNGDGKTDLAFANSALGITVLSGKGNGTFNANIATTGFTLAPKVAVFSPGQKLSILDSNFTEKFMLGNGDGTFTVKNTNCTVRFAAIGDFNHDGKIDYAGMNSVGSTPYVEVCLNNGDGTFTSTGQQFDVGVGHGLLLAGDFNNDDKLDLIASDANGFSILLGNGDGTFQNGIPTASPAGGSTLYALADFNHDGKLDVAVVLSPSTCYVFLGKGDGTFEAPITSSAAGTGSLSATDINGDGKPDLVLANGNYVAIMLGKGDGTFQTPMRYTVTKGVFGNPVVADFNLDGHLDVAIGSSSGELTILFNDGTGKLTTQTSFRIPSIYKNSLAVGDFNGDRKPDLVFLISPLNGIVGTVETMLHQ